MELIQPAFLLAIIWCCICADAEGIAIVTRGRPRAVIVLGADATHTETSAANELRDYIKRTTGAELRVVREGPGLDLRSVRSVIAVGGTKLAKQQRLTVSSSDPEAFRIVRRGNVVYLLGSSEPGYKRYYKYCLGSGIEFAVYEFLERTCGIRWLRPGPDGTYIPEKKTISVGSMDVEQAPSYQYRAFGYWYEYKAGRVIGTEYWKQRSNRKREELNDWMKHNKMNGFKVIPGGHAFGRIVPMSEHAEHPDYFALFKGSRKPIGGRDCGWQLCTTHPEVINRIEQFVRWQFARGRLVVTISPNDGGGFCECERCRALDDPDWKNARGQVVLSDRIATYVNEVARRVKDDFPDRFVGYSGYARYREPPRKVKIESNVMLWLIQRQWFNWIPGYREKFHEFYRMWREVKPDIFVLSGEFLSHEYRWGAPWSIISLDAEVIQWAAGQYRIKSGSATIQNDWGNNGIKYYAAARLLWDGGQKLGYVLDDYCRAKYGKAAVPMRKYWDRLEQGEREWQESLDEHPRLYWIAFVMPKIYSPAVLADCRKHLSEGARAAASDWAGANVKFTTRGFDYTEMTTKGIEAYLALLKARRETDVVRLAQTMRSTWKRRRAFIEEQRDEGVVGYGQYHIMILDSTKHGGQQSQEQRLAFFEVIEPERLLNPGIEDNLWGSWFRYPEGPRVRWTTDNPHSGKRCFSIVDKGWMMQFLALVPGRRYRFSGWIRTENVGKAGIRVQNYNRPAFMMFSALACKKAWLKKGRTALFTGTNDWQQVTCEFTPEAPEVRIECYVGGNKGEAFFDDFALERLGD